MATVSLVFAKLVASVWCWILIYFIKKTMNIISAAKCCEKVDYSKYKSKFKEEGKKPLFLFAGLLYFFFFFAILL